jgi:hypothetical protein
MDLVKFLVIDGNPRSRLLVVATLARNFPRAVITEASTITDAFPGTDIAQMDAVIGFFKDTVDACAFVHGVRGRDTHVPIVVMSEEDCAAAVLAAGATHFLSCDEWLLIGTTLTDVLNRTHRDASPTTSGKN